MFVTLGLIAAGTTMCAVVILVILSTISDISENTQISKFASVATLAVACGKEDLGRKILSAIASEQEPEEIQKIIAYYENKKA